MSGRFLFYLLIYLFIYLEVLIIIFDFSLLASESNDGKTGESWQQVLEFGKIKISVLREEILPEFK